MFGSKLTVERWTWYDIELKINVVQRPIKDKLWIVAIEANFLNPIKIPHLM
jgi:hypothetical protein